MNEGIVRRRIGECERQLEHYRRMVLDFLKGEIGISSDPRTNGNPLKLAAEYERILDETAMHLERLRRLRPSQRLFTSPMPLPQ
jgi:hypothetical protein